MLFNQDELSISIFPNVEKNDAGYNNLKEIWNINYNFCERNKLDLIDYKNLNQDQYINLIQSILSLNKLEISEHFDFVFTQDNILKIARILLNIKANIPLVIVGETGIGKTKLIKLLFSLKYKYHKILQVH